MSEITNQQREVLHSLGYLYLMHGQYKRALTLLMLAVRRSTVEDKSLLRIFAYALILNDSGEQAIEVIDRLETLEQGEIETLNLLRSRALLRCGRLSDARACFADYMETRAA